jgi:alpha-tubulin suppressor-like RCC1 family protein/PKD repeat protein
MFGRGLRGLGGVLVALAVATAGQFLVPSSAVVAADPVFSTISAGLYHACARASDGTAWCWGFNRDGELGDGTTTNRPVPVRVRGLTDVSAVTASYFHSCARKTDGTVWCWGHNSMGQLGDGTLTDRTQPVRVVGLTGVTGVTTMGDHTCARRSDGTAWCWGDDTSGELGDGRTLTLSRVPVQVLGLADVAVLSAGGNHTCAQISDGTAWCWGANGHGQLGDGSTVDRTQPVRVLGLSRDVVVAAGGNHTCARRSDGTVWCWGYNSHGQLGDGSTVNRTRPVRVTGLTGVQSISTDYFDTCARRGDGTAWCWGADHFGELGDRAPAAQRLKPVEVLGLADVSAIDAGYDHTCARRSDRTAWCWGRNNYGQLGNGKTADRLAPVRVGGLTTYEPVASFTARWELGSALSVAFDASGSKDAARYRWEYGDGTSEPVPGAKVTHAYASGGEKQVTLTAIAADGSESAPVTHWVTVNPVRTYAPMLYMHPQESYWPGSANTYLADTDLRWNHDATCDDHQVDASVSGSKLGSGAYEHRRADDRLFRDCAHAGDPFKSNDDVTPRTDNAVKGDKEEGFYLRFTGSDAALHGQSDLSRVPLYYAYAVNDTITYWVFYPYNAWSVDVGGSEVTLQAHQSDWEHVVVKLDARGVLSRVAFFYHGCQFILARDATERWKLTNGPEQGGLVLDTHPMGWVAQGSHGTYWKSRAPGPVDDLFDPSLRCLRGPDDAASGGREWRTWQGDLVRLGTSSAAWYGYGGAWGSLSLLGDIPGLQKVGYDGAAGPSRYKTGQPAGGWALTTARTTSAWETTRPATRGEDRATDGPMLETSPVATPSSSPEPLILPAPSEEPTSPEPSAVPDPQPSTDPTPEPASGATPEPTVAATPAEPTPEANEAPVADAGGPYRLDEGDTVRLDGRGSSDPDGEIVAWSWDRAQRLDDPTVARPRFEGVDDVRYPITLTVTDDDGTTSSDEALVRVRNVAPTLEEPAPVEVRVGEEVRLGPLAIRDPGVRDSHRVTVDWGDGASEELPVADDGHSVAGRHTYPTPGTFELVVTVTDDDGGRSERQVSVLVMPAQPAEPAASNGG